LAQGCSFVPADATLAKRKATVMASRALFLMGLAAVASGTELTMANWDAESAGKSVFIKFQAPW